MHYWFIQFCIMKKSVSSIVVFISFDNVTVNKTTNTSLLCVPKVVPHLYIKFIHKLGHYFLDTQYIKDKVAYFNSLYQGENVYPQR